jgi:hypothetical protein
VWKRTNFRLAAAALATGALVSGCGGGGESEAPSSATYRKLARSTCKAAEQRVLAGSEDRRLGESLHLARITYEAAYRGLSAPSRPPGFARFVHASGRVRDVLQRLDAELNGDKDFVAAQQAATALGDEASALEAVASPVGLADCGRPVEKGADALLVPFYEQYAGSAIDRWDRDMRRAAGTPAGDVAGARRRLALYEGAGSRLELTLGEATVPESLRDRHDAFVEAVSDLRYGAITNGSTLRRRQLAAVVDGFEEDARTARVARDRLVAALVEGS